MVICIQALTWLIPILTKRDKGTTISMSLTSRANANCVLQELLLNWQKASIILQDEGLISLLKLPILSGFSSTISMLLQRPRSGLCEGPLMKALMET